MKKGKENMFFGFSDTMTDEQQEYLNAIMNPNINLVIVNAIAGSGKTQIAVAASKLLIANKQYNELFYTFAPVEEQAIGYTPGDVFDKEQKYFAPLMDALIEIKEIPSQVIYNPLDTSKQPNGKAPAQNNKTWVKAASHTFLRGSNIKNKVVIIDEAQNFTTSQLRKVLTRCHDSCKVIMIGHTGQCDINPKDSGFEKYIFHATSFDKAKICHLTKNFRGDLANWADEI